MRKLVLATYLLAAFTTSTAFATSSDRTNIRVFEVNWDEPFASDSDTQMCDDFYYEAAEILIPKHPSTNSEEISRYIESQCQGIKVSTNESTRGNSTFVNFHLDGTWGCSLIFTSPNAGQPKSAATYKIDLFDAC